MKKTFLLVPLAIILVMSLFLVSCEDEPEIKTYTVTFLLDESDTEPFDKKTVIEGTGITDAKVPEKTGHKFLYWKTAGGNEAYELKTPVKDDLKLVAAWEINKYTVSFMDGEETAADSQTVEYGKTTTAPTDPTKEGHTFSCWKKVGSSSPFDFTKEVITEDIVLEAVWDINTYTVTFDYPEGQEDVEKKVLHGENVESPEDPNPSDEKYEFLHWTADAKSKEEFKFDTTPIEDNLTLYPVFGIKEFTVTFVGAEGLSSVPKPQKVDYGNYAKNPNATAIEGYIISGWTTVEGGDTPFDFSSSSIKSSITLYPIVKRILTLNFYDGEELKQTSSVESGSTFVYPDNPTKDGYDFAGWKKKGEEVYIYSSTVIDSDMDLEACWNKKGLLGIDENGNVSGNKTYQTDSEVKLIVIPEKIGEYIPKKITKNAFSNWDNITKVVLPPTIETIEGPEKTYTGEVGAFYGCSSLSSITIPSSVTTIGIYAFADSGLNSITINGSDTYLTIKYGAFSGCSNLESIDFSNRKTNLGERAFISCKGLESVILKGSFTGQGYQFKDCIALESVYIIEEVNKRIPQYMFYGCTNLKIVSLPADLTSIGSYAFAGTGLEEFTIPTSVTSLSGDVFENCSSLAKINVPSENKNFIFVDGVLYNGDKTNLIKYLKEANSERTEFSIPEGVKTISPFSFSSIKDGSLTSVVIPTTVTKIDYCAFINSTNLTSVTIGKKVEEIGTNAFKNTGLTSITIPSSVTSINKTAFNNCANLSKININKPEGSIDNAPWGAPSSPTVTWDPAN